MLMSNEETLHAKRNQYPRDVQKEKIDEMKDIIWMEQRILRSNKLDPISVPAKKADKLFKKIGYRR